MSKRTLKFFALLVSISAVLSAILIMVSTTLDSTVGEEELVSVIFGEFRVFFDLVAEFSVFGIIIYSFCHYDLKTAMKSFYFALGSFTFALVFEIIANLVLFVKVETGVTSDVLVLYTTGLIDACVATFTVKRALPAVLAAFLTYKFTNNYGRVPEKFISFKNPVTRTMGVFTLILFTVNFVSALGKDIFVVCSSIPEMTKAAFLDSLGSYILSAIPTYLFTIAYFLVFLYCALFLIYYISKKYMEIKPIKKITVSQKEEE